MKRFLPFLLAFALMFALFTPAFAAGKGSSPFTLVGKVNAIDPVTQSISVQVVSGNAQVKAYIGKSVTLKTTATTMFRFTDRTITTVIKFADLKVGDAVSSSGTLSGGAWTATRITVGAKLSCLK